MSAAVDARMILVCRRSLFRRKRLLIRSLQVRNPRPPSMISSMMTTLTTTLEA